MALVPLVFTVRRERKDNDTPPDIGSLFLV